MKKFILVIIAFGLVLSGVFYNPVHANQVGPLYSLKIYDDIVTDHLQDKEIAGGPITEADIFFKGLNPKYNFTESKKMINKILGEPDKVEEQLLFDTIFLTERVENSIEYKKDPENVLMRTYYYPDFEVRSFILNNVESIHSITLIGSSVKTVRGIAVGDSNGKVVEKYGQGESHVVLNKTLHFYNLKVKEDVFGEHGIRIVLEDDKVEYICIY